MADPTPTIARATQTRRGGGSLVARRLKSARGRPPNRE